MLPTDVFLFNSASSGGGVYTTDLYFDPSSQAKYMNVGDTVQDRIGNQYKVTTWAAYPSDHGDGGTVTMTFLTVDTTPLDSLAYDGSVFTPGQVDVRPDVQTDGSISSVSVYSGQDFEYQMTGSWNNSSEANKAVVGDYLIDRNGKSFEITFIDPTNRFAVPFRAKESEQEGVLPPAGVATLYSGTLGNGLFQGVNINTLAETNVRNRDTFVLDQIADETEDYTNAEGADISKGEVVWVSSAGNVQLLRADDTVGPGNVIGVAAETFANGTIGKVYVKPGTRITGYNGLVVNEPLYVSRATAGAIAQDLTGFLATESVVRLGLALDDETILFQPEYDFEY